MIKVIIIAQSETVYGLFQNVGEPERMVYHEVFDFKEKKENAELEAYLEGSIQ